MFRFLIVALLVLAPALYAQQGVDPARMTEHVKVLASDDFEGRGPATPGEAKTVDYIVKQFQALRGLRGDQCRACQVDHARDLLRDLARARRALAHPEDLQPREVRDH